MATTQAADKWHVILDALALLATDLDRDRDMYNPPPWDQYDYDPDDPKTTKQGYRAVLEEATDYARQELENS